MQRRSVPALFLAALLAALATPTGDASATILIKKSLTQLATEAEVVVVGKVTATRSEWFRDTRLIYTHNTIAITSVLKGDAGKSIVVSEPGGTVGEITGVVESAPKYRVGERVLVFCKKDALGLLRTHGMIQGRFSIVRNPATEEDLVPAQSGLAWVTKDAFPPEARTARGAIVFDEFVDRVEELIEVAARRRSEKR